MDFFSGLKKAYDSLGDEITKTFDSSQTSEDINAGSSREEGDLSSTPRAGSRSPAAEPPPATGGDQSSIYATPSAVSQQQKTRQSSEDDGGWGQWENQPLVSSTSTKVKPAKPWINAYLI